MTYRAPVADIAFALKHSAGLKGALQSGLYGDLTEDVIDAVRSTADFAAALLGLPIPLSE